MADEPAPNEALPPLKRSSKTALRIVSGDGTQQPPRVRRFNLTNLIAVRKEMASVYTMARRGEMDLANACRCVFILSNIGRVIVDADLEIRLAALEQAIANRGVK